MPKFELIGKSIHAIAKDVQDTDDTSSPYFIAMARTLASSLLAADAKEESDQTYYRLVLLNESETKVFCYAEHGGPVSPEWVHEASFSRGSDTSMEIMEAAARKEQPEDSWSWTRLCVKLIRMKPELLQAMKQDLVAFHRKQGLAKLTQQEKEALGL